MDAAANVLATGQRKNTWIAVAVVAELVYVAGRGLVQSVFSGAIAAELAITAWRLVFVVLYLWILSNALRPARGTGRTSWHPVLVVATAIALAVMPLAGYGIDVDWPSRLVFILTIPIVALREELFYRAILQSALERAVHPIAAILCTTVLFVLYHVGFQPMNPLTVSSIAAVGVLLGVTYQRTRNLWLVVVLHSLFDLVVLVPRFQIIGPATALTGNIVALLGVLIWWSFEDTKERLGI
jgi:membrane protease YdiL (CAAX protease family)